MGKMVAELAGVEGEMTTEQREEIDKLRTEYKDVEVRIQAATIGNGLRRETGRETRRAPRGAGR